MTFTTSTMRVHARFRENRLLQILLFIYVAMWIITAINPVHPDDWLLENMLVFLSVPLLALTYRRFPLSDLSYVLITIFLILHSIGAHYTYAEVYIGPSFK